MQIRHFWVLAHRYAGLAMTAFLIIVGLTGSLLAFLHELDGIVAPQFHGHPRIGQPLPAYVYVEKAESLDAKAQALSAWYDSDAIMVGVAPRTDPATQKPYELGYDQIIFDPSTSGELGRRTWGGISEGIHNLMPFIYKLHYALALDEVGIWILGITALIWTLDSFVGFYLTLPRTLAQKDASLRRSFWQRWQLAWKIKWKSSVYRVNFDLHRSFGLWLWMALVIFAWSSVYMNLYDTVYPAATRSMFSEYHEPWVDFPDLDKPLEHPAIGWREAYRIADALMVEAAQRHGFTIASPVGFNFNPAKGFYVYTVRSSADFTDTQGQTRLVIDATTGEQKLLLLPTGQYTGNTVTNWLVALHMANVFGLPYRIFVCLFGLVIVMLSVTGVVIWWKKRMTAVAKHNKSTTGKHA